MEPISTVKMTREILEKMTTGHSTMQLPIGIRPDSDGVIRWKVMCRSMGGSWILCQYTRNEGITISQVEII